MRQKLKSYYELTKPGIVYGNALHTIAGSLFAWSIVGPNWRALVAGLVGTAFIVAAACVVNCITDRELDARMIRTRTRPLVTGKVSVKEAVIFAVILELIGAAILIIGANIWAFTAAALCFITYTTLYAYAKRRSWMGAIVGTIPGALPLTAGYLAVDPRLTMSAWVLTLIIVLWQLPHFYALALYKKDDYARSGLPIISLKKTYREVVWHIIVTLGLYVIATALLVRFGEVPFAASIVLFVAALAWLVWTVYMLRTKNKIAWAKSVFKVSLMLSIVTFVASIIAVAAA